MIESVRKAVRAGADDSAIKFVLDPLPRSKVGDVTVGWAVMHWMHNKIRIPLVSDEMIALVGQYEGMDAGREKRALKEKLMKYTFERLKGIERMGKQLEARTDQLLNQFDKIMARLESGQKPTAAQVADIVKRLKEPRALTLPYLNSLDGEPPTRGPGTKVPMPELDF